MKRKLYSCPKPNTKDPHAHWLTKSTNQSMVNEEEAIFMSKTQYPKPQFSQWSVKRKLYTYPKTQYPRPPSTLVDQEYQSVNGDWRGSYIRVQHPIPMINISWPSLTISRWWFGWYIHVPKPNTQDPHSHRLTKPTYQSMVVEEGAIFMSETQYPRPPFTPVSG